VIVRIWGSGSPFLRPCHFFCRTVVGIFYKSLVFLLISYLQMLLYVLNFFSAQVIAGMPRSSPIFKIYTTGTVFITHDVIVPEPRKIHGKFVQTAQHTIDASLHHRALPTILGAARNGYLLRPPAAVFPTNTKKGREAPSPPSLLRRLKPAPVWRG
jgi:hypothetical protein